jgi:multicomponent Na+:H+ antiporter subunit B
MKHHRVLRIVSKFLIPFIMLFGLYVQFHGDFGPGGGFQAGVIFAAAIILYAIVFGLDHAIKVAPPRFVTKFVAIGLILYILVGVAGMFMGGEFLNYSVLGTTQQGGQHLGIFLVELGVGITVAATITTIFYYFAGYRGLGDEGKE